jgi:hypothetical protein
VADAHEEVITRVRTSAESVSLSTYLSLSLSLCPLVLSLSRSLYVPSLSRSLSLSLSLFEDITRVRTTASSVHLSLSLSMSSRSLSLSLSLSMSPRYLSLALSLYVACRARRRLDGAASPPKWTKSWVVLSRFPPAAGRIRLVDIQANETDRTDGRIRFKFAPGKEKTPEREFGRLRRVDGERHARGACQLLHSHQLLSSPHFNEGHVVRGDVWMVLPAPAATFA